MISLISSPSAISEVGNCIRWEFQMTGIQSGNQIKRFAYQLRDQDGNNMTQVESFTPKEGFTFPLNFEQDILSFIYTRVPLHNASDFAIAQNESVMSIRVRVHYWEIIHDLATCETTEGEESSSDLVEVVNAASNMYNTISTFGSNNVYLNWKPKRIYVSRNSQDMLYIYGQSGGRLRFNAYAGDQLVDLRQLSIDGGLNSYSIGPGNVYSPLNNYLNGAPSNITHVNVFSSDGKIDFVYLFDDCSHKQYNDIYFQQPEGGYSVMSMSRESVQVSSSFIEVHRYNPSCSKYATDELQVKGRSIAGKVSYRSVTFTKILDIEDSHDLYYYEGFLASGSYYVALDWSITEESNQRRMVKFQPQAGSLRIYEKEKFTLLTFTGRVPIPYNLPNYSI